jgi:hypothetical protein
MGSDMLIRDLYLPAGTTLDPAAAEATAGELCRRATLDDLRILLDEEWIGHAGRAHLDDWSEQALFGRADALRTTAEHHLHGLLDTFAASPRRRPVPLRQRRRQRGGGGRLRHRRAQRRGQSDRSLRRVGHRVRHQRPPGGG